MKKSYLISFLLLFSIVFNSLAQDKKRNLGPAINSPDYTDAAPLVTPDGKTLFFARQDPKTDYDIFVSYLQPNGEWGKAEKINELNDEKRNQVIYIYPDGNKIIIKNTYFSAGGYAYSERTDNGWSKPQMIKLKKNPATWDNQAAVVSSDGRKVIICNERDLYLSIIDNDGVWGEFQKLNGTNTSDNEFTPFLASDDKTLYFSSGGWGGLGSNDIVKSTRLDDTWLNWSKPESIGSPVNTSGWESYFSIAAKGDFAYVYMLEEGKGDIFDIKLKEEQRPNPVALLKGQIFDKKTNKPMLAKVNYENLTDNISVGQATTDPATGNYSIILQYGKKYAISAQAQGYISATENIDLSAKAEYQELKKDIYMTPLEVGTTIQLNNIFFETGKFELKDESSLELDRLVKILDDNSNLKIELSGHTDNIGNEVNNLKLSQNRADAVYNYLLSKSIKKNRLSSIGFGKIKPIADNTTEEGRQKNRRVEFIIVK